MKFRAIAFAVLGVLSLPMAARADDPNDPAMRDPRMRAWDREQIRRLNRSELAYVQQRDAGYAEGWRRWREQGGGVAANADYARERARYERDMAAWRRAVAACRAGDYDACQ
ncbi:MAG: hypothetical protein KGM17_05480 [Sphingomonadales bacterium]|nr:hypothetical protein [Sphingomonadales bacterium]